MGGLSKLRIAGRIYATVGLLSIVATGLGVLGVAALDEYQEKSMAMERAPAARYWASRPTPSSMPW